MKGITREVMAEIDKRAQEEYGISQALLMENAGRAVAEIIVKDVIDVPGERFAVFCGKGNNGGDGFVVARHIADNSPGRLTVYVWDSEAIKQGSARDNFELIRDLGINIRPIDDFLKDGAKARFTVGVDAVFGTGFKGELPYQISSLGERLNSLNIDIYAVDVPSGLNATTGEASKNTIRAYKTVAFGLPKQGFYEKEGPDVCGEIIVRNIGFPEELLGSYM